MLFRAHRNLDPPDEELQVANSIQKHYKIKLKSRCRLQLNRGAQKCRRIFQNAHDKCYEKLPMIINTILCWPMKIDYICDITKVVCMYLN